MSAPDPIAVGAELETLLANISAADTPLAAQAQRLTTLLMSFYGAGLSRLLEIVRVEAHGEALVDRLRADPLVASLLALHDLTPSPSTPLIQIVRPSGQHAEGRAGVAPQRCELCHDAVPDEHDHLVDGESRRLLCVCAVCRGVGGRYRPVPARYLRLAPLASAQWDALGIPVGLAFFVVGSRQGRVVACYPGPAGATESLLPLEAWPALTAEHPGIGQLAADVEALLVRRAGGEYQCYLVPIDACYELIGRIRRTWTGLGGGPAVGAEIDRFFDAVREKSSPGTEVCA